MKLIILIPLLLLTNVIFLPCFGQVDKNLPYEELEKQAIGSFRNNHTDSSITIMEYAIEAFPERFSRTSSVLLQIYFRTENFSKAIKLLEVGINKGYTFNLSNPRYQKYFKDNADFNELAQLEKSIMDSIHLKYEVILPLGYNDKITYPILFIFHGNNRNIESAKNSWNAPIMNKEFIIVFLQSYIPSSPTNFRWRPDDDKIKSEFSDIYNHILKNYPIDETKIIFSGMSAGGNKALEFTLNNYFDVSGLVLNCPTIPRNITDEMIALFVEKNKKMGIITGENDFALEAQKKLVSNIDSLNGQNKLFVIEGHGHDYAENFSELLNEYLEWVIQ